MNDPQTIRHRGDITGNPMRPQRLYLKWHHDLAAGWLGAPRLGLPDDLECFSLTDGQCPDWESLGRAELRP